MKELTGGRGVDIVYDPIGANVGDELLRCLAWCGRLLILGFLGGGPTNIRSNYLLIKGIDAIGVRIGGLNEADPALAIANMQRTDETRRRGQTEATHFAPVPARPGEGGVAGGDRPRGDWQGRAGQLACARTWERKGREIMDRATFEAALTRDGYEIVSITMRPDAVNSDARASVRRARAWWSMVR